MQIQKENKGRAPLMLRECSEAVKIVEMEEVTLNKSAVNSEIDLPNFVNASDDLVSVSAIADGSIENGGLERVRTYDLLIRSQVL